MTLFPLEADAAVLSVPPLFDEQTGHDVLYSVSALRGTPHEEAAEDPLRSLRLAGVLEEWDGLMRIAEPLRDDLRRRLAEESPDVFRAAAGRFAQHAANGFGSQHVSALGARPAALSAAILRVMAAGPDQAAEPLDELVELVASTPGGRRGDGTAAARQLEAVPDRGWAVDRTVDFLLGLDLWRDGDRTSAAERFASVVVRPVRDRPEAISRHLLGVHAAARADNARALEHLTAAVALLRDLDDPSGLAQTLTTLGRVLRSISADGGGRAEGRQTLAGFALEEAVRLGYKLDDGVLTGRALFELARVEQDYGAIETAIHLAQRALPMLRRAEDLFEVQVVLASLFRDAGMDERASAALDVAADLAARSGTADRALGRVLNVQASVDRRAGRTEDAIGRARQSVAVGELIRDRRHAAHAMHTLAAALLDRGTAQDRVEAARLLTVSSETLSVLGDSRGVAMIATTRSRLQNG